MSTLSSADDYLIYTRRSTDDADSQKNSIDYQAEQCRRYANIRGLTVADFTEPLFCEKGVIKERHTAFKTSGLDISANGTVRYHIERPKFQRLVTLLDRRKVKGVICLCWDRFSRNGNDDAIIKELFARGVDLHFVQATYERNSAGAIHMDIDGMMAANHSRLTSDRVRNTYVKLRTEGKCTNRAPLGYLDQGSDKKLLDPERAPIVRRLFELYATGEWSYLELARWARQQGLMTKPRRRSRTLEEKLSEDENPRQPVSNPVTAKTIENILRNPFYAGWLRHADTVLPGAHPRLVSQDLFDQVQRSLLGRTTSQHYVEKDFYTYRLLVRCQCRRSFVPYRKKGHIYYQGKCMPTCPNSMRNLSASYLDTLVLELFGKLYLTDQEREFLSTQAPDMLITRKQEQVQRQQELERRQASITRDLTYLRQNKITLLRERVYAPDEYGREMARQEDELRKLQEEAEADKSIEPEQMLEGLLQFTELAKLAQQSYKLATAREKHLLLTTAITELIIYDGNIAEVRAKDGFEELLKRTVSPFGVPDYLFTELAKYYQATKIAMEGLSAALKQSHS